MIKALVVLALAAGASAFAPSQQLPSGRRSAAPAMSMKTVLDMPGIQAPIGYFDPVGYSTKVSDEGMLWFRAAELKHSRVAMLAFVGWCMNGAGYHFPGYLSEAEGVTFESLSKLAPKEAWEAMPTSGKAQIVFSIFIAEVVSEMYKPHYTQAGDDFDPIGGLKRYKTPEAMLKAQNTELANGRLAMIGMMGFSAALYWPGSVPVLP
eukprot:CAMPEP_0182531068 /NCGR_PEP_ID=MMETSP1323-20130603/7709_1 /TAXON_ID=236787 /ORGANISM="Florenciella parvula, Strain RCC1693" /LENGTH=206 /DNA_ID=CAMNT_0024740531 /DNA_START=61 /DNA_END=681 /DNA_ORIENTATION=+